jgi:hypothetical protein
MAAGATAPQFVTFGLDANGFERRGEAESSGNTIFQYGNVRVFEFDDPVAIQTNKVVVIRAF